MVKLVELTVDLAVSGDLLLFYYIAFGLVFSYVYSYMFAGGHSDMMATP